MFKELRDFLFKENVVELAVAVIIAGAFGAIVTSLVEDILTPLLGLLGIPDFSTWTIQLGDAEMRIGAFLNTLISFLLIGASIFFLVVKPMNALNARKKAGLETEAEPTELDILTEIRDELRARNN